MSATMYHGTLATTLVVNGSVTTANLISEPGTGWSTSPTGLFLNPPATADLPALYFFSITPPSGGYAFNGTGTGTTFSEDQNSAYGVAVGARCAFMVAMNNLTGTGTANNSLTLTVTSTTQVNKPAIPVDPSVAFNPPG